MYCKNCGKEMPDNAVVCISCGCSVEGKKNKKSKKKILIIAIILFFFFVVVAASSSSTETSVDNTESNSKNETEVITTTVPEGFEGKCPIDVSSYIEENIIGVPELVCNIESKSKREIAAIQFYFVPQDVYGEEVNTIMTSNKIFTDDKIGAKKSTTRRWQLLDQNIKKGTLYVYSIYFTNGTEWGDKNASTGTIKKYGVKIEVKE